MGWDGRGGGEGPRQTWTLLVQWHHRNTVSRRYLAIYPGTCMDIEIARGEPRDAAIGGVMASTVWGPEVLCATLQGSVRQTIRWSFYLNRASLSVLRGVRSEVSDGFIKAQTMPILQIIASQTIILDAFKDHVTN
jgi:hypothetical protein